MPTDWLAACRSERERTVLTLSKVTRRVLVLAALWLTACSEERSENRTPKGTSPTEDSTRNTAPQPPDPARKEEFLKRVRAFSGQCIMTDTKGRVIDLGIPSQMEVRKEDVALIGRMSELWRLNFGGGDGSSITDEDLAEFGDLTKIRWLILAGSKVTDAGIQSLKNMKELERLLLWHTKVTDDGLAGLVCMTKLKELGLRGTGVTDAGLAHLIDLTNLKNMDVSWTKVGDAGLVRLAGLFNLTDLNLEGTAVSDAGLVHLEGLEKLRFLYVGSTKVTDDAVAKLKGKLPKLNVGR